MRHLKARLLQGAGLGIASFVITLGTIGATPTESVDDKSVDEQVCIQSKNTTATAGIINILQENSNSTKINIQEKVVEEVALEEYEFVRGWTTTNVNVRLEPDINSEILEIYFLNTEISYVDYNDEWIMIPYENDYAYISKKYISNKCYNYEGEKLTQTKGVNYNLYGTKETYYNLPMGGVVRYMKDLGIDYEYWVRSDGVKMYGDYVIVATDTFHYPKGTIIETSLGLGMVCDHCESAAMSSGLWIDIAVTW